MIGAFTYSTIRQLQDGNDHAEPNSAVVVLSFIAVGLIGLCGLYCTIQVIRFRCSRSEREAAMISRDGFSLGLNSYQRRAILEAIFSDTSKAVTQNMFFTAKRTSSTVGDGPKEYDISRNTSEEQTDDDSVDLEANSNQDTLSPRVDDATFASSPKTACPFAGNEIHDRSPMPSNQAMSHDIDDADNSPVSPQMNSSSLGIPENLACPTLEESNEEVERLAEDFLLSSLHFVSSVSFRKDESADVEDEEEHLCAICLSDYVEGEIIISSKYCDHMFHKDCILEWLDKNDECPCCRVDMVTSSDVTEAAEKIVGKTELTGKTITLESIRVRDQQDSPIQGVEPNQRVASNLRVEPNQSIAPHQRILLSPRPGFGSRLY